MIYVGDNEITNIYIGDTEIYGIYAGDLQIYPTDFGSITAITISGLTWVTDVPASGGTADSGNCSFKVVALYDSGKSRNVTNQSIISGSLVVSATTAETREMVGTLTLTATYSGFTASASVDAYQKAYQTAPISITSNRTYFNIGYTATSTTKLYIKFKPHTGGYGNQGPASSDKQNTYIIGKAYTGNNTQFSINCYYNSTATTETKFRFRYYAGRSYNDNFILNCPTEEIYEATLYATGISVSGGGVSSASTFSSTFTSSPIYLLGGDTSYNGFAGVITFYEASIYENDVLVKHYIPWEDGGYGCVKETISNTIINAYNPSAVIPNYS